MVQVITGTVNTPFFENQAKYLDLPESNEPHYGHSDDKANITSRFSLPKLAEPDQLLGLRRRMETMD